MTDEVLWADFSFARPDVTPFFGVMRYLKISQTSTAGLTAAEVADLQAKKKAIGLIWETGANAATGGSATALDHALRANAEADRLGVPKDTAIFYAVDFDATPAQVEAYVRELVKQPGRPVGIYGSYFITTWARTVGVKWTWQTLAWSKGNIDSAANLYQRDFLTDLDRNVEMNVFPAWGRPLPVEPPPPVETTPIPPKETPVASCKRTTWRGVIVCAHSVPKYNAWAASVGAGILLQPLAGCGSYQTTTVASAGTHAGGGAIDIDLRAVKSTQRKWVADKGRTSGLQVAWHRNAISGLWTWHCHALDPACPNLAKGAVSQCYEAFAGGDGLVGSAADGNTRANMAALVALFKGRLTTVVTAISDDAKVRLIQQGLRITVDGKLGDETYWAVWRLSKASAQGRKGFYQMPIADRKKLQKNIGCTWIDGQWSVSGSEMPKRLADAVGGVQRTLGLPIDRKWSTTEEGPTFGALMARVGYKP